MARSHGEFGRIMMTRNIVNVKTALLYKIHKSRDPDFIAASAYRGTADLEAGIKCLYRLKCHFKELKIFLHVRVFPEDPEIGFIPYFYRPGEDLFLAVSVDKVAQGRGHKIRPELIILRGSDVALPVEDRLFA